MGLGKARHGAATAIRSWAPPAILAVLSLGFELGGDAMRIALRVDRAAIGHGEWWRLATGHLVHLGWSHFALNLLGLALVWFLVGDRYGAGSWCIVMIATLAGIDLGLWFAEPDLSWYVGLSGLLHGVLAAGIVSAAMAGSREAWVLGFLVTGKLFWEQAVGPLPGSDNLAGGAVVVNAHLYGTLAGTAIACVFIRAPGRRSI